VTLDMFSVVVMSTLVVVVSGVVYIVETLLRRDDGAGRIWAVAFLAAMLTTVSYMVWANDPDASWAIAVGNAAFVTGTGCIWIGCWGYNERSMVVPGLVVAVGAIGAAVSVVLSPPDPLGWNGALWMFVALLVFAGAGAVECLRGEMRRSRTPVVLAFVLGLQALFYVARIVGFFVLGPQSDQFNTWLGTIPASFLTITFTIVALVVTSILRAGRTQQRGFERLSRAGVTTDGILPEESFRAQLSDLVERAGWRGELVGVIVVRIDDLHQISTAFGSEIARAVSGSLRSGVRRHSPSNAFVGEDGAVGLAVGMLVDSASDARRRAALVYRGLFEGIGTATGGVIPVVGVGVALTDTAGYDTEGLLRTAREAAHRAATSVEASVIVADAR
jgi:GGDEF domain-containing protein